jgi:hypothetical protein
LQHFYEEIMKRATRDNIRRARLNDTEDANFGRACAIAKTTGGKQLRSLVNSWTEVQLANDRRKKDWNEGAAFPINRPFILPSRANYGAVPRIRMHL